MMNKETLKQRFEVLRKIELPKYNDTSFVKFNAASAKELKFGFIETIPKADASRSTLEGLKQTLQAGVEAEFTLCLKTSEGEMSNQADLKDQVEVLIEPAKDVTKNAIVSKKGGSDLQVKFIPIVPGECSIEVKINGAKLSTCPLTVQVKERELVVVGELDLKFSPGEVPQGLEGIAVNAEGKIALTDADGHFVYEFDRDENCLRKLGGKGGNPAEFKYPAGVTYVNNNEILIADQCNHRIQHINIQTGTVLKSFGKCGTGKGEFKNPLNVCLDDEERIVVTEFGNHRIQVLSREGETISIFGDSGPEKLKDPTNCIPFKDKFLVADYGNNCIKVFDQSGTFLYKFGEKGNQDGQFDLPYGMLLDSSKNLLLSDYNNNRVQQFSLDGRFTGKTITRLPNPAGIATAPDGRIFVASPETVYVLR